MALVGEHPPAVSTDLVKAVDRQIHKMKETALSPEGKGYFNQVKPARTDQKIKFEKGANTPLYERMKEQQNKGTRDSASADSRAASLIADSDIPGNYFQPGKEGKGPAKDFMRFAKDRPEAVAALRDYASARALETKTAKELHTWIEKHSEALQVFPELRENLKNLARARKAAENSQKTLTQANEAAAEFDPRSGNFTETVSGRRLPASTRNKLRESGLYSPENIARMRDVRRDAVRNRFLEAAERLHRGESVLDMVPRGFQGGGRGIMDNVIRGALDPAYAAGLLQKTGAPPVPLTPFWPGLGVAAMGTAYGGLLGEMERQYNERAGREKRP